MGICSSDLAVPAGEVAGGIQIRGHSENIHQRRRHGSLGGAETLPATSACRYGHSVFAEKFPRGAGSQESLFIFRRNNRPRRACNFETI